MAWELQLPAGGGEGTGKGLSQVGRAQGTAMLGCTGAGENHKKPGACVLVVGCGEVGVGWEGHPRPSPDLRSGRGHMHEEARLSDLNRHLEPQRN